MRVGTRGSKCASAFHERVTSGVGVGINKKQLTGRLGQGSEKGVGFSIGVAENRDRVPGCDECWRHKGDADACFKCRAVEQLGALQVVERGCPGTMDAPWLLAHRDDAAARSFRRREVDVRELGQSVTDVVVDGSLANLAAFDVGDGNAQSERDGRGRHHLVAIRNEEKQVGTPCGKGIGEGQNGDADGLCHTSIGVGTEQALKARLDGEPVAFDLGDRIAELRRQVRAECNDSEFDVGVRGELAKRPVEMAVVGARSGYDCNSTFGTTRLTHGGPARRLLSGAQVRCCSVCSRARRQEGIRARRRCRAHRGRREVQRACCAVATLRARANRC